MSSQRYRIGLRDNGKRIWIDFPYDERVKDLLQERVSSDSSRRHIERRLPRNAGLVRYAGDLSELSVKAPR